MHLAKQKRAAENAELLDNRKNKIITPIEPAETPGMQKILALFGLTNGKQKDPNQVETL